MDARSSWQIADEIVWLSHLGTHAPATSYSRRTMIERLRWAAAAARGYLRTLPSRGLSGEAFHALRAATLARIDEIEAFRSALPESEYGRVWEEP